MGLVWRSPLAQVRIRQGKRRVSWISGRGVAIMIIIYNMVLPSLLFAIYTHTGVQITVGSVFGDYNGIFAQVCEIRATFM